MQAVLSPYEVQKVEEPTVRWQVVRNEGENTEVVATYDENELGRALDFTRDLTLAWGQQKFGSKIYIMGVGAVDRTGDTE